MVYLKIPIGNNAHEDTSFIHIHGRNSVTELITFDNSIYLCKS